jgi:hypothetical protein
MKIIREPVRGWDLEEFDDKRFGLLGQRRGPPS